MKLSACIEWLFANEAAAFEDRIHLAAEAGLPGVEFWMWRNKDLDAIERALRETNLTLTSFLSEPLGRLVDPATHAEFLEGLKDSIEVAQRLGAKGLIVVSGDELKGVSRDVQKKALIKALQQAAPLAEQSRIDLLLEPLNTRVDHQGYFLDATVEGLEVLREVASPNVKLLYDMYHSLMMDENPSDVLQDSIEYVGHVHVADVPGRHELGSGRIDWSRQFQWLASTGYSSFIGLEYKPQGATHDGIVESQKLLQNALQ